MIRVTEKYSFIAIRVKGEENTFLQRSYAKYYDRLRLHNQGKITKEEIYGLEQAKEHIAQLKEKEHEGEKIYADKTFEIIKVIYSEEILNEI